MNRDVFCVLFFLAAMFLLVFCGTAAEVYEDPDGYIFPASTNNQLRTFS